MLLDKNVIHETHYEVLNVKEDSSYEEIRASYCSAILSLHADKLLKSSDASGSNQTSGDRFLKAVDVAEDLSLEDMMGEDDGEALELFYQCRCGDYFSIDSLELHKMGYSLLRDESRISILNNDSLLGLLILPCGSCSLKALEFGLYEVNFGLKYADSL
ncbi:hypothetical protein HN51_027436 [Arachis hypogaea]|uniref:DPH-type MB domain-containing protein n=1 Tax=Arachis hypogaea TaxID=3818 RepID=A0A445BN49_ARAHY|nr:Diphthamide biosynthesis protein [Arachis hypogaea]RYR40081.1 hypothetical protein Ahy_A09g045752 isoform A [Arachis hypogaea]